MGQWVYHPYLALQQILQMLQGKWWYSLAVSLASGVRKLFAIQV